MAGLKETFLKVGDAIYDAASTAKAKLGVGAKPSAAAKEPAPVPPPEEKVKEVQGSGYIKDIGDRVRQRQRDIDSIK